MHPKQSNPLRKRRLHSTVEKVPSAAEKVPSAAELLVHAGSWYSLVEEPLSRITTHLSYSKFVLVWQCMTNDPQGTPTPGQAEMSGYLRISP